MFNEALSKENTQKDEKDTKILDLLNLHKKIHKQIKTQQNNQNNQISVEEMQSVAPTDEVNLNLKDEQYEKVEPVKII